MGIANASNTTSEPTPTAAPALDAPPTDSPPTYIPPTEPPPKTEMKEDFEAGPNRTAAGATNSTFTPDSGPMKRETDGPEAERGTVATPLMSDEDLAARDASTFEYLRAHPEYVALGLGALGLAAGAAPATVGVAGAEAAAYVGGAFVNVGIGGVAGRLAGRAADLVLPGSGVVADLATQAILNGGMSIHALGAAAFNRGGPALVRAAVGAAQQMTAEEAYMMYDHIPLDDGPYPRLETVGGEVTDEMGRVMRADEMRVRRPAEEVMRANPVHGGGVMGMFEPGELEVLRGHPFHGDVIARIYRHAFPGSLQAGVMRGMGQVMSNIAFQLNPARIGARLGLYRVMVDQGMEGREARAIMDARNEGLARIGHADAVRDAGARVIRDGTAALNAPAGNLQFRTRAQRLGSMARRARWQRREAIARDARFEAFEAREEVAQQAEIEARTRAMHARLGEVEALSPEARRAARAVERRYEPDIAPAPQTIQERMDVIREVRRILNAQRFRPMTDAEGEYLRRFGHHAPSSMSAMNRALREFEAQARIAGMGHRGPGVM